MSDTDKKTDQDKGDEVLRRMLSSRPDPRVNQGLTKPDQKGKPSDTPGKKHRSEEAS